jgi:pimeloyl-ACP methyl ester carboxylesterase
VALRLQFVEEGRRRIADVVLPRRMHFIYSEAFRIFSHALAEYVDGHVLGRSFLIAGNRGAGKTTLVLRAIAEHYDATLKRLADATADKRAIDNRAAATAKRLAAEELAAEALAAGTAERTAADARAAATERRLDFEREQAATALNALQRRRRPLLVKLHGPSLVADHLPGPGSGEVPKPASPPVNSGQTSARGEEAAGSDGASSTTTKAGSTTSTDPQATAPSEPAHAALVQIAIGLYRALADEFSECFARQVRAGADLELLELAAQLRLDLDQGADPAIVRSYWAKIGSLQYGVLWPREIAEAARVTDQGLRELLALVTAGQAFQVCAGVVKYTQSQKDLRSSEATREGKTGIDFKDLANRLAGLTVGGLVGWGVAQGAGAPAAAGAGLGAALIGGLSMTWSSRQTMKRERNLDYTFIFDRSKQTLERDLPLVIERIRHAGLAPIFVIDELDKLDAPRQRIGELIGRLKHLTTDYGFFCFLTDREYYDTVARLLGTEAYPKEHTFFSDRLFILYTAEELSRYVRAVITSDAPDDSDERKLDELARAALAKIIVHRSKLNTIDAVRQLSRGWTAGGAYETSSATLTSQFGFRLTVAVQLAVEFILRFPEISGPMRQSPSFPQVFVDALYRLSRAWESEVDAITSGKQELRRYLTQRIALAPGTAGQPIREAEEEQTLSAGPGNGGERIPNGDKREAQQIADEQLLLISNYLDSLFIALCDFQRLRRWLEAEGRLDAEELRLLDMIPGPPAEGLLHQAEAADRYEFIYSAYGRDKKTQRLVGGSDTLPPELRDRIEQVVYAVEEIAETFQKVIGVCIEELVAVDLLPQTVDWNSIDLARERLEAHFTINQSYSTLATDLPLVEAFAGLISTHGSRVALALFRALVIAHDMGSPISIAAALRGMRRYLDLSATAAGPLLPAEPSGASLFPPPPHDARTIRSWRMEVRRWREQVRQEPPRRVDEPKVNRAWYRWAGNLLAHFSGTAYSIEYEDLLLAAAGRPPATLFQSDLGRFGVRDWTDLCLFATKDTLQPQSNGWSAWAIIAGVRALQFDKEVLIRLAEELKPMASESGANFMSSFAEGAQAAPPGALVVVDDPAVVIDSRISNTQPCLAVLRPQLTEYEDALKWLWDRGVYQTVFNESEVDAAREVQA